MTRRTRIVSAATWLMVGTLVGAGAHAGEFRPDPDGWIRQWIVYGPIGVRAEEEPAFPPWLHPVTFEHLITFDLIREAEGQPNRQTEANFLPKPGKEIDTRFRAVVPDHKLREGAGRGINPNEPALMGIGWVNCDCTINFDRVFNIPSLHNDGASPLDLGNSSVAYAYAYVTTTESEPLEVFISLAAGDAVEVLIGAVPETRGEAFMEPIFLQTENQPADAGRTCVEKYGPDPDEPPFREFTEPVTLQPDRPSLLLVKVLDGPGPTRFRFRFRRNNPPDYTPVTDEIRIRLSPDADTPDPVLFKRMDVNADGKINPTDVVGMLGGLFGGQPAQCPDAADANDDGELSFMDPIFTLGHLFEGARAPFPRGCCGLDPTWDELAECEVHPEDC